jgi:sugar/nucleoside kinase (ribokinase family)
MTATLLVGVLAWPVRLPGSDGVCRSDSRPVLLAFGERLAVVELGPASCVVRHGGAYLRVPAGFVEVSP